MLKRKRIVYLPKLTHPVSRRMRVIPLIVAVLGVGVLLSAGVLWRSSAAADYVQDKWVALQIRVAEAMPRPTAPPFIPTPFQVKITFLTQPAPSYTPPPPAATPLPAVAEVVVTQPATATNTPLLTATAAAPTPAATATPAVAVQPIQPATLLTGIVHERQGWNNCGPTTLKMYLQYYGRSDTQKEIAAFTKPNWDDKNVSPQQLTTYAANAGMGTLVRHNGTLDHLKLLLSNGLPVMIESGFVTPSGKEGWMGHYKLLIGYDEQQFTFMDSYNGPDQKITFAAVDVDWQAFNRLYLIVYPPDKEEVVRAIVGDDMDDATMYTRAVQRAQEEIKANPQNAFAQHNLGTSLNGLGQYTPAAEAFDKARMIGLPWRMLWYQFGPYVAYLQVGRYNEVIALADATLSQVNDLEESHYYKGLALRALSREAEAKAELQVALSFNPNYLDAQQALQASTQ
jgi:hypothetical protein